MKDDEIKDLEEQGFCILRGAVTPSWLESLTRSMDKAVVEHRALQIKNNSDIDIEGVALNVILSDDTFVDFLGELVSLGLISELEKTFFKGKFILNSFSALNNLPGKLNFSGAVHRDIKFFTGASDVMLNVLILLDDFTEKNGPTLVLPYSHRIEEKPTDEQFYEKAIPILGKMGDILLFNSNVWHASSPNTTLEGRRALPLTFTKSNMKQLVDLPRALGYDRMEDWDAAIQGLLGYHSRVAASLDEWYQDPSSRFYKKDQD